MGNCTSNCLQNSNNASMELHNSNDNTQKSQTDLNKKNSHQKQSKNALSGEREVANQDQSQDTDSEEDDSFEVDAKFNEAIKKKNERGHKTISAESYGIYNKKGDFKARVIPKTDQQKKRIVERLEKAFMFAALDDRERNIVIDAMEEKTFKAGEFVIKQGDSGDSMYIVDAGQLDCFKKFPNDKTTTFLKTYQPGESFGELALLYNVPRAATITAKINAVLWELDRETFNNIVKDSAVKRRERYENFLQKVEILKNTDPYERSKIADVLKTVKYNVGDYVIRQGENGDTFYFIEEGQAVALKKETPSSQEKEVFQYKSGDFFGELALTANVPRQASIKAKTELVLAAIDRDSFKRILGNLEAGLQKQTEKYVGYK